MRSNIFIVANRLPFNIHHGLSGFVYSPSPGGMAAALGPVRDRLNAQWIGWAGLERPITIAERAGLTIPDFAHDVDIPADTYHDYYHSVANGSLWPVLHGLVPRAVYTPLDWASNLAVNQRFADRIVDLAQPNDIIWVHDFHLIMLPELLKKAALKNRIGFFLHVPVANQKTLALLPHWPDMLRSLSNLTVCGVQTERDAKNLQRSFAVHNIPAPVIMHVPIGIDDALFADAHTRPAVKAYADVIKKETKNKTVIVSISRLDYTKGIVHQLQAIRALLAANPKANIMYELIVAPSREALSEYRDVKNAVDKLVSHINKTHPGVVAYEYRSMGFDEITAWYNRADIMLVTPIIDGMNLVAKEYIAARQKPGVLILSKTAGAAKQLEGALLVDPTDVSSTVAALCAALAMPAQERAKRHQAMRQNVETENVFAWAEACIAALKM